MIKSATISRDASATTAQDYAALLALGIRYCQQMTEDSWTDYDEHDPGVTILEQLCYALTDLGLRNSQPMPVLLAPLPGVKAPPDALIAGERILASAPWTVADYRRMLYDRVVNLKNAWLAMPDSGGKTDSAGLYQVRVEMFAEDMHGDGRHAPN